jgi:sigma-54-specific transcriptional regulator
LFLDEIGDLSPSLQVKLLRVLQERQVVRLGSTRPIALDVRLVAATNVNLAGAVRAQHFRADLFYRLSVTTVALPPLRERAGDILPLAEHFIAYYGTKLGMSNVALAADARSAMLAYAWPGNIRELENAVHHALIVCRDGLIREADMRLAATLMFAPRPQGAPAQGLPASFHAQVDPGHCAAADRYSLLRSALSELLERCEPDLFDRVEAELVGAAFAYSRHNQVRAATALGIARNPLRTLLKRHGLLQEDVRSAAAPQKQVAPAASAAAAIAFGHPRPRLAHAAAAAIELWCEG